MPSGPTRAGWDHGNKGPPCVAWRLDHILFTRRSFVLKSRWATLKQGADAESGDQMGILAGLPNLEWPSDHVPVAAAFEVSAPPQLATEPAEALLERVAAVDVAHCDELNLLRQQDAVAVRELEASLGLAPPPTEEGKKPAKKKKGKPPEQVMTLQRNQRTAQKELAARQKEARAGLLNTLGELELDLLESRLKGSIRDWNEQGAKQGLKPNDQ